MIFFKPIEPPCQKFTQNVNLRDTQVENPGGWLAQISAKIPKKGVNAFLAKSQGGYNTSGFITLPNFSKISKIWEIPLYPPPAPRTYISLPYVLIFIYWKNIFLLLNIKICLYLATECKLVSFVRQRRTVDRVGRWRRCRYRCRRSRPCSPRSKVCAASSRN